MKKDISKTNNETFDRDGYFVIKNLCDPQLLRDEIPEKRGRFHYHGSLDKFDHFEEEEQVSGSVARYFYPRYKAVHSLVRRELEKHIGKKLYNTYYYDRFYFPGQELTRHVDRDACEISVSIHISTSLKEDWPLCIETPDGVSRSLSLAAGDGMVYKGRERPHWRDPMPGKSKGWFSKKEDYFHQIFFHYVLADGYFAHCAFDASR